MRNVVSTLAEHDSAGARDGRRPAAAARNDGRGTRRRRQLGHGEDGVRAGGTSNSRRVRRVAGPGGSMRSNVRWLLAFVVCALVWPSDIARRSHEGDDRHRAVVAGGQAFGQVGPYEKLTGTIEFALDPADTHNTRIVDLEHATRGADGRVHFSADLYVLQPVDTQKGNGALLFEIANRGRKGTPRALQSRRERQPGSDGRGRLRRRLPDEGGLHARVGRLAVRCPAAASSGSRRQPRT